MFVLVLAAISPFFTDIFIAPRINISQPVRDSRHIVVESNSSADQRQEAQEQECLSHKRGSRSERLQDYIYSVVSLR